MRFPAGKKVDVYKGVNPPEVLDMDTGCVRLTIDDNGLNDHYVLFRNQEVVGALSEFADGRVLQGRGALDYVYSLDKKVLAEKTVYSEEDIDSIQKDHPEIFLAFRTTEKFKIGSTLFTGVLSTVKQGDFLTVLHQLEEQHLTGCLRVTIETEEAISEGAVLFVDLPVAALFESGRTLQLGDDAVREIALRFKEGKVYKLEKKFVENFLFFNNASRLKSPVEEIIASEKASGDLERFIALQSLGLDRGTLVLSAPCNGVFSFEALLRSAASRKFDGYLWVKSDSAHGLMVMGQGKVQAAYTVSPSEEAMGAKALGIIYKCMESTGAVDFYQLPSTPPVAQAFEVEEETDSFLVERLLGDMGHDLIKEVSVAKEFKKRWKGKREKIGE